MMAEPLSLKFIHKPARSKELIKENSLNYKLTQNSQYNRSNENEDPRTDFSKQTFQQFNDSNDKLTTTVIPNNLTNHETRPESPKFIIHNENSGKRDDYFGTKLVRKKSGEILKSSLKDKFISKSLPSTPNLKQVHFGTQFDVKFFRKKDKPNAISATNSPVLQSPDLNSVDFTDDTDDSEYSDISDDETFNNFGDVGNFNQFEDHHGTTTYPNPKHQKLIDWKLKLSNISPVDYHQNFRSNKPIFLERIFISIDKKFLLGHIAVKNLSFEKSVSLKYTFNNWSTIIEVPSIYVPDFPQNLKNNGYDRFIFKIALNDLFVNNSNSFYQENNFKFCIYYKTPTGEYWDNNNFNNYEINIIKIIKNDNYNNNVVNGHHHSNSFSFPSPNNSSTPQYHSKIHSQAMEFGSPRPKYSNSYLKRINSDSQLDIDYVKNNYYLSSPLLSSFKYYQEHDNTSTDTLKFNATKNLDDEPEPKKLEIDNFKLNNMEINSKSYKDLIDNYCFFNSDKNNDDTFSVSSLLGT